MLSFDPKFIDASEWQVLPWFNSGGTRTKRVLQDNEGGLWYFKCSERKLARDGKPEKYYKYEFWSEIIAYQLGKALGLDILRYDVALHDNEVGCISPLMINQDEEQLVEVGRYMTALNPLFNPEDRKTHQEYTFEFLVSTLEFFDLNQYSDIFLKTILFDALIGNTDRHQENWAFITRSTYNADIPEGSYQKTRTNVIKGLFKNFVSFYQLLSKRKSSDKKLEDISLVIKSVLKMAPIYDSGSSLGRELSEERIVSLLNNENLLKQYITNGKSELHWGKKKVSHVNMIANLLSSAYLEQLLEAGLFLDKFDEQNITQFVSDLGSMVPTELQHYCLPFQRKKFIIKLLILRSQILKEIINDARV